MQCQVRGMDNANPRVSDTLPKRGRVGEVCREWIVHEDEALAYQLQKQEVEQHYGGNKERNARVREDFPKAKEEQEKEIAEAAEKYRQMIKQQEQLDSTYALHIAEKLEKEELERRRRAELRDMDVARKMQVNEATRSGKNSDHSHSERHRIPIKTSAVVPDVNQVGLPVSETVISFEPIARHQAATSSLAVTHNIRNLKLSKDDNSNYSMDKESSDMHLNQYSPYSASTSSMPPLNYLSKRLPPPPPPTMLTSLPHPLPEEVNQILADVDLQEEVNRRLQEEKDEELARMLQKQEEEILTEEIDRDRMIAIEAQDEELARLLYEKDKAKLRRAKERARQRALLKKQQQEATQSQNSVEDQESLGTSGDGSHQQDQIHSLSNSSKLNTCDTIESVEEIADESTHDEHGLRTSTLTGGRTTAPPLLNVAMHIDPTYLQQQSSSVPNSLLFQENDTNAPPYMPIQGHRRNSPLEKKPKKSKSKDSCKQQ